MTQSVGGQAGAQAAGRSKADSETDGTDGDNGEESASKGEPSGPIWRLATNKLDCRTVRRFRDHQI